MDCSYGIALPLQTYMLDSRFTRRQIAEISFLVISTGDGNGNRRFAVDQAAFLACNLRVKG
jgi:hypothetical protein